MTVREYNNLTAVIIGIAIIFVCCLISWLFQKNYFSNRARAKKAAGSRKQ